MRFVFKLDLVKSVITNSKYDMISTSMDFAGKILKRENLDIILPQALKNLQTRLLLKAMNLRFFLLIENRLELCCQSEKQWEFSKA